MRSEARKLAKENKILAEELLEDAIYEAQDAREAYRKGFIARRRVDDVLAVLNARQAARQLSRQETIPFVSTLLSALTWEFSGDHLKAAAYSADIFPTFTKDELIEISINGNGRMSNQAVARCLQVTLKERQALGLSMIGACDLSDDEYALFLKEQRKLRNAESKRRSRSRNLEQRRKDEEAKRDELKRLALHHGKSVRTIRVWIANGKIEGPANSRP